MSEVVFHPGASRKYRIDTNTSAGVPADASAISVWWRKDGGSDQSLTVTDETGTGRYSVNLGSLTASNGDTGALMATITVDGVTDTEVTLDHLRADAATSTRSSHTAAQAASATRTELTTELGRIDANISSRSTFAGGAVASVTGAVGSVTSPVTVGTNNDKAGYSLTTPPLDAAGTRTALGLASANLDAQFESLPTAAENGTAAATAILVTPANKLLTDADGHVTDADSGGGSSLTAADVWTHSTRELTAGGNTGVASAVWAAGARTLTGFGSLVNDIWTATTRTLSAFGFEVTLTEASREATAVTVESHLLDEGDTQPLIDALVTAIQNSETNVNETALVAAIRADLERGGGHLATLLLRATEARLAKLDVSGTLAHTGNANDFKADVSGLATATALDALPTAGENASAAAGAILSNASNKLLTNASGHVTSTNGGGGGGGDSVWSEEEKDAVVDQVAALNAKGIDVIRVAVASTPPVFQGTRLTLVRGDAYLAAAGTAIARTIVDTTLPSTLLTDGTTVTLRIKLKNDTGAVLVLPGAIVSFDNATKTATVQFDLTAEQTATLTVGDDTYRYDVQWLYANNPAHPHSSIADGKVVVVRDQR